LKNNLSQASSTDVLISGAGPTGLMLANFLAKEKISFRIIEADSGRHKESRALAIQARSMELFQNIGLVDKFLEAGMPGIGISIRVKGKEAAQLNFSDIGRSDTPFPYICFLSQSITESILEDSVISQGVKIERQTMLEEFEQDINGVVAKLKHSDGTKEILTAKYLVGCDGARSQVRKSSGLEFVGGTYAAEFMLADAKINWDLPCNRLIMLLGDKNLAMIMPLKGSQLSRVITVGDNKKGLQDARENLTTKSSATIEEVQENLREASSSDVKLTAPEWVTRYRVHHRSVKKMKIGRIFLAGDAAHIHSPAGGQGMNTGIQDAANLAWKLASVLRDNASIDILETYDTERWPIAQKLLHFTDRLFSMASSQSSLAKKIRNFVVPFAAKAMLSTRFFRRYLFGFVSQLNIHYHESLVVKESLQGSSRKNKIHAGCRTPDAKLNNGESIFELIKGYKFRVLVMSRLPIDHMKRKQFEVQWKQQNTLGSGQADIYWIDEEVSPEAIKVYQVNNILVSLIRPDGYIGYQADHL